MRALVHRFCTAVKAGKDLDLLVAELPRVRGQVYKVKRFHATEGAQLAERVDEAARLLRNEPAARYPKSAVPGTQSPGPDTHGDADPAPWEA